MANTAGFANNHELCIRDELLKHGDESSCDSLGKAQTSIHEGHNLFAWAEHHAIRQGDCFKLLGRTGLVGIDAVVNHADAIAKAQGKLLCWNSVGVTLHVLDSRFSSWFAVFIRIRAQPSQSTSPCKSMSKL